MMNGESRIEKIKFYGQKYYTAYSSIGDSSDKISRLDVLECQLIVGNKICSGNSTDGFKWVENN